MRLMVQRVARASVRVDNVVTGEIGAGLLVLVGLGQGDSAALFPDALDKLTNLRIFPDDAGNMNRSLLDIQGGLLLVSQFTLYADTRKGRRPSFIDAMPPGEASPLFDAMLQHARAQYTAGPVAAGIFGAMMAVELVNDGPVTLWLDSAELGWPRKR